MPLHAWDWLQILDSSKWTESYKRWHRKSYIGLFSTDSLSSPSNSLCNERFVERHSKTITYDNYLFHLTVTFDPVSKISTLSNHILLLQYEERTGGIGGSPW